MELCEGLAGIDRVELLLVADQHHARDAQGVRDAEQIPGLDGGGERAFVDHQHGLAERGAHPVLRAPGETALGDPCVAGQEPLQGLALDAGLGSERACGRGRRRKTDDALAALLREEAGAVQHGRLAGAGVALDADHPIPCREDETHRLPLARGQPSVVQPRSHHPAPHDGLRCASASLHERDDLLLVGHGLVRGERIAQDLRTGRVQGSRPLKPVHGLCGVVDRDRTRLPRERRGEQIGACEHRLAFGEMPDRPGNRPIRVALRAPFDVAGLAGIGGQAPVVLLPRLPLRGAGDKAPGVESEVGRLPLPAFAQRLLVDVALVRAGHQRCTLGETRIGGGRSEAVRRRRRFDLGASRRERLDHPARHARDLETPVGVGLLDPVAERLQPSCQLAPVQDAEQHLRGIESFVGHRAPLAVLAPDHVREHRVGVKLRIEIARGVMAERGDDRLLSAGADHAAGLRILHPRLDGMALGPGECALHGRVMGGDDPPVAADQGGERDGLRRGEGEVATGPVMKVAVPVLAAELSARPVGHLARKHVLEEIGIDGARQPQRLGASAGPDARFPVLGIVLRVVAVAFVVGDALRRRGDGADREHDQ